MPEGQAPPAEGAPPEGRRRPRACTFPTAALASCGSKGERRNELGFATAPAPGAFSAVYQTFPGALIILNQNSGQVVVLPTANQR